MKDNNFTLGESDEGFKNKFRPYQEIIENLTNSFIMTTDGNGEDKDLVVECMLSKDEQSLIIILKQSDELYII